EKDRRTRQVREKAIGIRIGGKVAHAVWHVEAVIEDLHLGLAGSFDQPLRGETIFAFRKWRQTAQKVGPVVSDEKEMGALRVVGAACRASRQGPEIGLGHDRTLRVRIL